MKLWSYVYEVMDLQKVLRVIDPNTQHTFLAIGHFVHTYTHNSKTTSRTPMLHVLNDCFTMEIVYCLFSALELDVRYNW